MNQLELKKPSYINFPLSIEIEKQSGQHEAPPSALILRDVAFVILSFLPVINGFALVNKSLNQLFKEVFFFPLLRMLPEVKQQLEMKIPLTQISEKLKIGGAPELAHNLAERISNAGATESEEALFDEAIPLLESLAEEGYATAQYELGRLFYEGGNGIQKNYKKALEWLGKAASTSGAACIVIGRMFAHGRGVPRNCEKAQNFFLKAAKLGAEDALNYLGAMYLREFSLGGYTYAELAMEYLQQASNRGSAEATANLMRLGQQICEWHKYEYYELGVSQYFFGMMYMNGWYVQRDISKGINCLISAIEKGSVKALFKLSDWCIQTQKSATAQPSDNAYFLTKEKAFACVIRHLKKAAKHSNPEAFYTLGTLHEVNPSDVSQKTAAAYFEQAVICDKHKKATEKVGSDMLSRAAEHLKKKEYSRAYAIYAPLAETGNSAAQQQIIFMVRENLITKINKKLFMICCKHLNDQERMNLTSDMASAHMKTPKFRSRAELEEAKTWFEIAAAMGNQEAQKKLAKVEKMLKSKWLF